jgi:hypothetical protein
LEKKPFLTHRPAYQYINANIGHAVDHKRFSQDDE